MEIQITSAEIKARINNKQVLLNGDPIDITQYRLLNLESAVDLGTWLTQPKHPNFGKIILLAQIYPLDVMPVCNCKLLQQSFEGVSILRLSKKEVFVIRN